MEVWTLRESKDEAGSRLKEQHCFNKATTYIIIVQVKTQGESSEIKEREKKHKKRNKIKFCYSISLILVGKITVRHCKEKKNTKQITLKLRAMLQKW